MAISGSAYAWEECAFVFRVAKHVAVSDVIDCHPDIHYIPK